jgi:hypothetical protein
MAGLGAGAMMRGIGSKTADMPSLGYAEQWLAQNDLERQAHQERLEARWDWWTQGIAMGAVVVASLSLIVSILS